MSPPLRRRHAWGTLLSEAPWDGQRRAPTPIRIPATVAERMPANEPPASQPDAPAPRARGSLRRAAFGQLLADAPWSGPRPAEPLAVPVSQASVGPSAETLATL